MIVLASPPLARIHLQSRNRYITVSDGVYSGLSWWDPYQAKQFMSGQRDMPRPKRGTVQILIDESRPDKRIVYLVFFDV